MERVSPGQRLVEANSTRGQGSRRAVEPGDEDDDWLQWFLSVVACDFVYL
jgi:hypothetical protein